MTFPITWRCCTRRASPGWSPRHWKPRKAPDCTPTSTRWSCPGLGHCRAGAGGVTQQVALPTHSSSPTGPGHFRPALGGYPTGRPRHRRGRQLVPQRDHLRDDGRPGRRGPRRRPRGVRFSDGPTVVLAQAVKGAAPGDGHAGGGNIRDLDGAVLAGLDRLGDVFAHLIGVHVERGDDVAAAGREVGSGLAEVGRRIVPPGQDIDDL